MLNKKHSPFSLVKHLQKDGSFVWYARFWDEVNQRYSKTRTTGVLVEGKKERRDEAFSAAIQILPTIRFSPPVPKQNFLDYVADFWTPESAYVREHALVAKKPLSSYYIKMNHADVKRHLVPFAAFSHLALEELKPSHIRDWMIWAVEKGLGPHRINAILSSMRVAIRYAVSREELERDPFIHIKEATESPKEKGVLVPGEILRLINLKGAEPRAYLGVLLGVFCGLRRGEARGLRWEDIDFENKIIHVQHNYLDDEGSKVPKRGSVRTVPIPTVVNEAFLANKKLSPFTEPDDFVLFCVETRKRPIDAGFLRYHLSKILVSVGISSDIQKARNLTFHGLRHTFVTLGRMAGISDLEIQTLAGHKSHEMMDHYSHAGQVIDYAAARDKLEKVVNL
jgi:integrase